MLAQILPSCVLFGVAAALGIHSLVPFWKHLTSLRLAQRGTRLQELGFEENPFQIALFVWAGLLVGGVFLLAGPLGMWPVAIGVAVIMFHAPGWCIDAIIRHREKTLRNQLAPACFSLACGIRAGMSLPDALERTASDTPQPLRNELMQITTFYCRGMPLRAAIEQVHHRLGLELFSLVATALNVTIERGGNLNVALDRIATTVRETQRLECRLDALTSAPRKAVITLAAFPPLFLGMFYMFDKHAVATLFTTFWGQLLFCGAMLVIYVSFRWANSILRSVM